MSLSQWTIVQTNGSHSLDVGTVIEGSSTLRLQTTAAGEVVAGLTSGAAVTTGKIRSIVRFDSAGSEACCVFGMMQSSIAVTSGAYVALLEVGDVNVYLYKRTPQQIRSDGGGVLSSTGRLASAAHGISGGVLANNNYALELMWQRDSDSGFVLLTVAVSPGTVTGSYDFSTLATKITHTDNSSPYSSGVSAGVARLQLDGGTKNSFFDKTQIFRV